MNTTDGTSDVGTGLMRIQSFEGVDYVCSGGFLRAFPFESMATISTILPTTG
jgi:hypothetical protein